MRWVLDQLRKYSLFANLKKCRFHQDKACFLGYIVSSKGINMEAEQIEVIRKWPKPNSVRNIQVFLGFANFYCQFIKGFSKIAALLTSMLKTTISSQMLAANEVLGARMLAANKTDDNGGDDRSNDGSKRIEPKTWKSAKSLKLSKSGNSKGKELVKSKKPSKSGNSPNFDAKEADPSILTFKAKSVFNCLWLVFTKTLIL